MPSARLSVCPNCNEETLRKKVSAAGFRLKGAGWYETDFKSDKRKNIAGEPAKETPGKAADDSAESKPKTKAKEGAQASSSAKASSTKASGDSNK